MVIFNCLSTSSWDPNGTSMKRPGNCCICYDWPGNVRQLINAIERTKILSDGQTIRASDLPREVREAAINRPKRNLPEVDDLATLERSIIIEVLQRAHGNKTHAAQALGIHRRKLYRLIKKYGIVRFGNWLANQ